MSGMPSSMNVVTTASALLATERRLPVLDPLVPLLSGGGLVRGRAVATAGPAAYSLALALTAAPTRAGSWVAFVGLVDLGWSAAAEVGVALERTVLVASPSGRGMAWGEVLAALADGFDLLVVPASARLSDRDARRVQQRLSSRGGVLIVVGGAGPFTPDLVLDTGSHGWSGVEGDGAGRLCRRAVRVVTGGRRAGGGRHQVDLLLPDERGRVETTSPVRPLVRSG
jgi:hypothetical protein